jgi:release factor glutamine methyltransferase
MKPKTVEDWLKFASEKLIKAETSSAKLDAELILAKVLRTERTKLHSHPFRKLSRQQIFHANNFLNKRAKRVPLAYIFNEKEFFDRNFYVNENVLVPRPETENIIEIVKKIAKSSDTILDVGTGSGVVPVSLKAELGDKIEVLASDISLPALAVANLNSKKILNQEIELFESDLLDKIPEETLSKITTITANLPYIDRDWIDFSKENELHHEPEIALYAEKNGLSLIKKLIQQTEKCPRIKFLILEADPTQFDEIEKNANNHNFARIESLDHIIVFKKNTRLGQ